MGTISLFLTFSYFSWLVFLIILNLYLLKKAKTKLKYFLPLISLTIFLYPIKLMETTSFTRRWQLIKISLKMFLNQPFLGTGWNNFIIRMEKFGQIRGNIRFLQPVHNIFLLLLAETGIIGTSLILIILYQIIKKRKRVFFPLLFSILFLGLFDHYWLTIEQGILTLGVILGLSLSSEK